MKKILIALSMVAASASGCVVNADTAKQYAQRAHPECSDFLVLAHSYSNGKEQSSLTEVNMKCGDKTRSITVKCHFGMGIISNTVCHENN